MMRVQMHCAAMLILVAAGPLNTAHSREESPYRMQGVVIDADTHEPVAGAVASVLIESEADPVRRVLKGTSNAKGLYAVELPIGHAWAWILKPPPGYVATDNTTHTFITTNEKPIRKMDYEVRKGFPIKVTVRLANDQPMPSHPYLVVSRQQAEHAFIDSCELDSSASAIVTLPEVEGKYTVSCANETLRIVAPENISIDFQKGFDLNNITDFGMLSDGKRMLRDANGLTAAVQDCDVVVGQKPLTLIVDAKLADSTQWPKVRGRIVDANGAIEDAVCRLALYGEGGGSSSSEFTTTTDKAGQFSIALPKTSFIKEVALIVTHQGHAGLLTKPRPLGADGIDAGTIKMEAGCSVKIRVVDAKGTPLPGAIVEPGDDYAARTRIARTDANGECTLTDLSPGIARIDARFGGRVSAASKFPLDRGENELIVVKLVEPQTETPAAQESTPPLAAGTPAPQWNIAEWSDDQARKLSDYAGKVVVLDFWGIWCGPCVRSIPAMKELHQRYEKDDVVFFAIHTAGTDMTLVKRLLKQKDWNAIVGLDSGDDMARGATTKSYAVPAFPTVVVIGRDGKISYNSGDVGKDAVAFERDLKKFAESVGVPLPDTDASDDENQDRMRRLQVALFSQKIDAALKTVEK